jgi:hypothetical protein
VNLHAATLRTLLVERGVHVVNVGNAWKVFNGVDRLLTYWPASGECAWFDAASQSHRMDKLRGNPERIADILESHVR